MKLLMIVSDGIQAELTPLLTAKGWEIEACKKDALLACALAFSPDFILIQSDTCSMAFRGILSSLYKSGCTPYIVFFELSDNLTFASSKRLEEPFISLHSHWQEVLDALLLTLDRLGIKYSECVEFKEDDYIEATSMTFKRGENMREMLSGLNSDEFFGIVNKLALPFKKGGYYLLLMSTAPEFSIDYHNNRRVYYFLEVLKAKAIWALLENSNGGILFRTSYRNTECVLFNAPETNSSRKNDDMLKNFLNILYNAANDGLTAFVLSTYLDSPEQIHDAYEDCFAAVNHKVFYPQKRFLTLSTLKKEPRTIPALEAVDAAIQRIRAFDVDMRPQKLKELIDLLFLGFVRESKDLSIFNYCQSALDLILNQFCMRYSLGSEHLRAPGIFEWNRSTETYSLYYFELFMHVRQLATDSFQHSDASVNKSLSYIHNHYKECLSLSLLASVAGLNPSYFSRKFKNYTGTNLTAYIENYRIEIAKKLLLAADKKIYEVAIEIGYDDARLFSRVFKKHSGMSPSQYSKSIMAQYKA